MCFGTFRSKIKKKLCHVSLFVEKIACCIDSAWIHCEEATKLKQHLGYR